MMALALTAGWRGRIPSNRFREDKPFELVDLFFGRVRKHRDSRMCPPEKLINLQYVPETHVTPPELKTSHKDGLGSSQVLSLLWVS